MEIRNECKRRLRGLRVFVLLFVAGIFYLATLATRIYLAGLQDDCGESADVIIVMGAAQFNGQPSKILRGRLDHALSLYNAKLAPFLLFTGGKRPGDNFTEAQTGMIYAREHGVPVADILLEDRGRTTLQSLQGAAKLMRERGLHSAILVSDPFHVFRLRRMARDLGLPAVASPAATSRVRSLETQTRYIGREVVVYTVYRMIGI